VQDDESNEDGQQDQDRFLHPPEIQDAHQQDQDKFRRQLEGLRTDGQEAEKRVDAAGKRG